MRQILSIMTLALWLAAPGAAQELSGHLDFEMRGFPEGALFEEQHETNLSIAAEPELFVEWAAGTQRLILMPFARFDLGDAERTHVDLREAYWRYLATTWDLRIGLGKVFWGVTESQHLVDIINQTDQVEGPDGEDKLGQPMVQWTWFPAWGTVDVFILPFFRERTFPGEDGRLRFPLLIDTDPTIRHERVDLAVRWSRAIRRFDIGVAHFWGTSREPRFAVGSQGDGLLLRPVYETIHQTSLDAQATVGSWAWKLEALTRSGQGDRFYAVVGGFEYTFGNVRNTGYDLGLLAEYHYDSRDAVDFSGFAASLATADVDGLARLSRQRLSMTAFNNDLFVGARLALNDVQGTELLGGAVIDGDTQTTALFFEAGRRIGSRFTLDVEARSFLNTDPADPFHNFRRDSYAQLNLGYHF